MNDVQKSWLDHRKAENLVSYIDPDPEIQGKGLFEQLSSNRDHKVFTMDLFRTAINDFFNQNPLRNES